MGILDCQGISSAVCSPRGIPAMGPMHGRDVGWRETTYGTGQVGSCKLLRKIGTYPSFSSLS